MDELKRGDGVASDVTGEGEEVKRGLGRGDGEKRGASLCGARGEGQRGGGDDGKCAFGADDEVTQVVTCVVLAQAGEAVPDLSVGGDGLDPQTLGAGVAVAQDVDATGVGGQHAADRGGAFGGEREGEEAVGIGCGLLDGGEGDASLGDQDVLGRVDGADGAEAVELQDDGGGAIGHELAADEARAAAEGDDGDAGLGAGGDEGGDLGGGAGGDGVALSPPAAARFGQDGVGRVAERLRGQEGAQVGEEGVIGGVQHGRWQSMSRARDQVSRQEARASGP